MFRQASLLGGIIGRKEVEHSLGLSDFRSARIVQPQSGDCRSADGGSTDEWKFVPLEMLVPRVLSWAKQWNGLADLGVGHLHAIRLVLVATFARRCQPCMTESQIISERQNHD